MAAPSPSWSVVPVYGVYTNPMDGSPVSGSIKLTINNRVVSATDGEIFPEGATQTVALGAETGSVSVSLPAVDDPDISPDNWSIKVEEKFTGLVGRTYYIQPTLAMLDLTPPGLNLCTIILDDSNSKPTVAQQKGVPGGLAALNDQGKVIDSSGNVVGTGGAGTVDSVNNVTPDVNGNINLTQDSIGLDQVDNTQDQNKSVASAAKWTTARTLQFTGDVTGEITVDGSANVSTALTFAGGGTTGNALVASATQADAWTALGDVPTANLPDIAITNVTTVANQTARLALTAQQGDVAKQTDTNITYILTNNTPSVDGNWMPITAVQSTASQSTAGIVQLASVTEATTGTDTAKAVTSAGVFAGVNAGINSLFITESGTTYPNRPAGTGLRIWVGSTAPTGGGTTAGGAGAVDGLDLWFNTGA